MIKLNILRCIYTIVVTVLFSWGSGLGLFSGFVGMGLVVFGSSILLDGLILGLVLKLKNPRQCIPFLRVLSVLSVVGMFFSIWMMPIFADLSNIGVSKIWLIP